MANPNPNPVDSDSDSENETFSDAIDHLHTQSPPTPTPPPPYDMDDNDDDDTPQSQQQQRLPYHIISHYPNGIFMRSVSDSPPDHFHTSPTPPMLDPAASAGGDTTPAKALPGEEEEEQQEEDKETTSSLDDKKNKNHLSSPSRDATTVGAAADDDDDDDIPMMSSPQSHENEDQNENDAQHKDLGGHEPFSNFIFVQDSTIYRRRRPESSTPSPAAKRHVPEGGLEIRNVPAPDDGVAAGSRKLPTSIRSFLSPKQTKGDASIDSRPTSRPVPSHVQEKATQEAAAVSELPACLKDLITHLLAGMPDSGRKCDNVDFLQTAATKGFHFRSPRWHRPGGYSAKTDT